MCRVESSRRQHGRPATGALCFIPLAARPLCCTDAWLLVGVHQLGRSCVCYWATLTACAPPAPPLFEPSAAGSRWVCWLAASVGFSGPWPRRRLETSRPLVHTCVDVGTAKSKHQHLHETAGRCVVALSGFLPPKQSGGVWGAATLALSSLAYRCLILATKKTETASRHAVGLGCQER